MRRLLKWLIQKHNERIMLKNGFFRCAYCKRWIHETHKYCMYCRRPTGKGVNGMRGSREEEILRQQLELLAENSKNAEDRELVGLSSAMCEVCANLRRRTRLASRHSYFFAVCTYSVVSFIILHKKFFRRKS